MTPEHAYKEIAPRLRGLREAVDLTIEELAKKTGIPPQQVTAYESGATEIPVSYLSWTWHECAAWTSQRSSPAAKPTCTPTAW